ncbi:hypothetical protein WG922_02105 [Ramlibacter sp. AN1015]|uniref:hypothetical protein n=1 Tax=Ramlibacter sp. AN1015 TaxID=3133428 RepID=UPI0030BDE189
MNRWTSHLSLPLSFSLAVLAASAAAPAFSQVLEAPAAAPTFVREAPRDVRPARMKVTLPPQITLDGTADRLSPGARIRDTRNMLVLSGSLAGRELPVVYRRDAAGLVHEAWLLTEAEYARLGGSGSTGDAEAVRQFQVLLATIFGARR